jgi:hypothetical protein
MGWAKYWAIFLQTHVVALWAKQLKTGANICTILPCQTIINFEF